MRQKLIKKIRKEFRETGRGISAEPYEKYGGMVVSSEGRRRYQLTKKAVQRMSQDEKRRHSKSH